MWTAFRNNRRSRGPRLPSHCQTARTKRAAASSGAQTAQATSQTPAPRSQSGPTARRERRVQVLKVPRDGTLARNMLCYGRRADEICRPLLPGEESHVTWSDTRHHPDYFPAGRLQRPVRRLRLWHGPLRHGPRWRYSDRAAHPAAARQDLSHASH